MSKKSRHFKFGLTNEERFVECFFKGGGEPDKVVPELYDLVQIDCVDKYGNTGLHYASLNNNYEYIDYFMDRGASVSIENQDGKTCLCFAVANLLNSGRIFTEEAQITYMMLVKHGANVLELEDLKMLQWAEWQKLALETIIDFCNQVDFTER